MIATFLLIMRLGVATALMVAGGGLMLLGYVLDPKLDRGRR